MRYTGPNAPQILKCSSLKMVDLVMHPAVKDFLCDLLNALIVKYNWKQEEGWLCSFVLDWYLSVSVFSVLVEVESHSLIISNYRGILCVSGWVKCRHGSHRDTCWLSVLLR